MTYEQAERLLSAATLYYNHDDILYVMNGGKLKRNKKGYVIAPYGNIHGKEVYND